VHVAWGPEATGRISPKKSTHGRTPRDRLSCPLDVPAETAHQVARWLSAYRNTHDTRPWQRAATPFVQAVMGLFTIEGVGVV
jgi:hypothetical protein